MIFCLLSDDHCYKHNCTKNSECVSTEDGYECVCVMGFTGFCNNCDGECHIYHRFNHVYTAAKTFYKRCYADMM